jgi:hypothetical protein
VPITVRVDPNLVGGTITSPPSVVKVGIPFPIATVVNNAYSFKNWTTSGGGTLVIDSPALPSTNATLTKVTGTAPLIIQANFYTRPTVIVSPGFGASGQFLNQPILLQFTNKMVSSTLNLTSVTVNEKPMAPGFPWVDVTSTLFQGVSPTDSGRTDFNLVYKSGAQLTPYSYYQVTIAKTVQDDNGNAMAADAIYSFSTGGSANTSPPVVTATAIARTSTPSTTTTSVYTNSSQVYLSVTSTDLVAVVGLQITESNGSTSVVKSIANPGSGYFAYALDPSLGQGDHTVTVKALNSLGLYSTVNSSSTVHATFDTTAPTAALGAFTSNASNSAWAKNGNTLTLAFTASDTNLGTVAATINGTTATVSNTGGSNYTASAVLSGNALTYSVAVSDLAGNSTTLSTGASVGFTIDNTAPTVTSPIFTSNNATNTAFARNGDTLTLTFSAADTNLSGVTVSINSVAEAVTNTGGSNYMASQVLSGSAVTYSIQATDQAGNITTVTTGASIGFAIDNTAPSVGSLAMVSNNANTAFAKSGDTVTLSFTASDTNLQTVAATLNGAPATVTNTSGSNYTATAAVGASDVGSVPYSITVTDKAGNSTAVNTGVALPVTADNTAPALTLGTMTSNNSTNTAYAKSGNTITLNFTASDTNLNLPTATINGQSATVTNTSGSNYTATIALSGGSGALSYQVTATDKAGNSTSNTTGATQSFTVDNTAPAVALGTVTSNNSTNTGFAKAGDTITLNFTVTDTNPGVVTASINSQSATVANTGINYTATITLVGGSGTLSTSVTALDLAGNTSGAVTAGATQSFVVDNTAPSVTVGTMTTTKGTNPTYYAKSGDVVTLNFTASDTNMGTPTATINGNTATIANPSGNNYTATWTVGASDNGTVTYSIIVADLAGNSTTKTTGSSTTVTADNTAPTVTMGAMTSNNANNLYAKSGNVVTLNWTASDTNLNTVAANINGAGATVTNSYKATYTVGASDAGLVPYTITVTDLAGNQTVRTTGATSTVFMDNTPPTVTVTFTVNGTTVGTSTPDFISTDTIAVSASVTDSSLNASGATIQIDNHSVTESTVDGGATWTASRLFGSDNVQSYSVVIVDMAGNQTTRTGTLTSGTFVTTNLLWRSALGRQTFSALAQTEAVTTSAFDPWALLGRLAAPAAVPDVSVPTATPVAYVAEQRSAAPVARAARVTPAPKVNASEAPPLTPAGSAAPLTAPPPAPVATSAPTEVSAPAPAAPAPAAAPPLAPVAAAPGPAAPVAPAAPRPTPQDKGSPRIDLFWEEARIRRGANDAEDEKE